MEYKKIINLLDNETTQPSKFRTKNWAEINDDRLGTYDRPGTYDKKTLKFKTTMLNSSLCDYSGDTYLLREP